MYRIILFALGLVFLLAGLFADSRSPMPGSDRNPPANAATTFFERLTRPICVALARFSLAVHAWLQRHCFAAPLTLGLIDAEIDTPERGGDVVQAPLAAATKVFAGGLGARDAAGRAVPATDTAGLRVFGRFEETVDNSAGLAAALNVRLKRGVFRFANSVAHALTIADIGKVAYVEDDATVASTSTNFIVAGRIVQVDDDGVWVDTRFAGVKAAPVLGNANAEIGGIAIAALTSTDGTAAAANANLANLAAETEKVGDDVRALHATVTTVVAKCEELADDVRAMNTALYS